MLSSTVCGSAAGSPDGQDTMSSLDVARTECWTLIRETLTVNVDVLQPYGYFTGKNVENVLNGLTVETENRALRSSTVAEIYQQSMTDKIDAVKASTCRREPYGPLKARVLSEIQNLFRVGDADGDGDAGSGRQQAFPPPLGTMFAEPSATVGSDESVVGSDDKNVVRTLNDTVKTRYSLRLHRALSKNVSRAEFFGNRSRQTVVRCLDELVAETNEEALGKCMLLDVYRAKVAETIDTIRDNTRKGMVFEPCNVEISSSNRRSLVDDKDTSVVPVTTDPKIVDLSNFTYEQLEEANRQRNRQFLLNVDCPPPAEPSDPKDFSSLDEVRNIPLSSDPANGIPCRTELVTRPSLSKATESGGRPKPYDLPGGGRRSGCYRDDIERVRGGKKSLNRYTVVNMVTDELKPLYRMGYLDRTGFRQVAKSISENLLSQRSDDLDEKMVSSYVASYFDDEENFKKFKFVMNHR